MKAARYYSNDDVRVEDVPIPQIKEGEILVEMRVCGVCGSDVLEWYRKPRAPLFLGHELSGIVAKVGEGVRNVKKGDRVFVHHHIPCYVCHHCLRGHYSMCESFRKTHFDPGGFAQYVRVPKANMEKGIIKIPDTMSFEEASLIEPVSCCLKGVQRANLHTGDTVLVIGSGFIGLVFIQLAQLLGAGMVVGTDFIDFRLQKASQLGADYTINPGREDVFNRFMELNSGEGADVVIVTAGSIEAIEAGMRMAGKGSSVCLFGVSSPEEYLPVSPHRLFSSEITLMGVDSSSEKDTHAAFKFLCGKKINSQELITHRFPLNEIGKAFQIVTEAKDSLKVVILPWEPVA